MNGYLSTVYGRIFCLYLSDFGICFHDIDGSGVGYHFLTIFPGVLFCEQRQLYTNESIQQLK
jgi:hypothetical protein